MKLPKIFLSHSSVDKNFVRLVWKELGDMAILDEVNFDAGARTIDEIRDAIEGAKIFVAFLSQKALDSEWVQKELAIAYELVKSLDIRMLIFSIDKTIRYTDIRIPKEISKNFNIRYITNAEIIVSRLRDESKKISILSNSLRIELDNLFIGRNDLIQRFEEDFSEIDGSIPTYAVASNFYRGMGRRKFLWHALTKIGIVKTTHTPVYLYLAKGESVENFLIKLNGYLYDDKITHADLRKLPLQRKIELALEQVLEYKRNNRVIFIIDEGAIVLPNHTIVEWFHQLTQDSKLHNRFTFCLISLWTPNFRYRFDDNSGALYNIGELQHIETKNLFLNLLNIYGLKGISESQKKEFLTKLTGMPAQILFAVQHIRVCGAERALMEIEDISTHSDSFSLSLIEAIRKNDIAYQMMILLSHQPMSIDIISDVFGNNENIISAIQLLSDYSAISFIDSSITTISLNPTLVDFITRKGISLDERYNSKFKDIVKSYLKPNLDLLALQDYSKFMLSVEEHVRRGIDLPDKYYIAPLLIKNIMQEYNAGHYKEVEKFCISLLKHNNYDSQVIWELRYHLARVYARTANKKFWDAIRDIRLDQKDREFLIGFYYRNQKDEADFREALVHFQKVLDIKPNHSRARREMVNTFILLEEYDKALTMAKENYEQQPADILHLHSYFITIVRSENFDPRMDYSTLNNLIKEAEKNIDMRANDIVACMYGEFAYFVDKEFRKAEMLLKEAVRNNTNQTFAMKALYNIYRREGMFDEAKNTLEKLKKL